MRTTLLAALAAIVLMAGCNKAADTKTSTEATTGPQTAPMALASPTPETAKPRLSEVLRHRTAPRRQPELPRRRPVSEPPRMSEVTRTDADGKLTPAAPTERSPTRSRRTTPSGESPPASSAAGNAGRRSPR